jgi:hypothetical protein
MKGIFLAILIIITVGFSSISKADYNSYYDCKKNWHVCAVVGDGNRIFIIQMHEDQTTLDSNLKIQIDSTGKAFLETFNASIEIGSLGEKHETAYELKLNPSVEMTLTASRGPDALYCNPVDGPLGNSFFQRDWVHTRFFQIQILEGQQLIADWNSSKPEPFYPAYKSTTSTKACTSR